MYTTTEMNDQDLAYMVNALEVPVAIRDILSDKSAGDISDEMHFALHDAISDMQPDAALLTIALSARHIIFAQGMLTPSLQVLEMECKRLIADYAHLWIEEARTPGSVGDTAILSALMTVPEDLEGMADMLQTASDFMLESEQKAQTLLTILHVQARAHSLIAQSFVEAIEEDKSDDIIATQLIATSENVIAFPGVSA